MANSWPATDERAVLTLACCGEQLTTRFENSDATSCVVHLPVHACTETTRQAPDNVLSWFSNEHCWTRPVMISGMGGYPRSALWVLEAQGKSQRWQRRDFVRVHTSLEVSIYNGFKPICVIEAVDISEGGMRVALTREQLQLLPPIFDARVNIPLEARLPARVVWSAEVEDEDDIEALAGLEFQGVEPMAADLLRAYVFGLHIEQRRRGLVATG